MEGDARLVALPRVREPQASGTRLASPLVVSTRLPPTEVSVWMRCVTSPECPGGRKVMTSPARRLEVGTTLSNTSEPRS